MSLDAHIIGKVRPKVLNKIDSSIQLCYSWYIVGSSTACIVALHKKERRLYTANLGDSGFLVIRDDQVVHRSQEQQHYFNTPFQLAVAPPSQAGLVLSDRLVIFFLFYSLIGKCHEQCKAQEIIVFNIVGTQGFFLSYLFKYTAFNSVTDRKPCRF